MYYHSDIESTPLNSHRLIEEKKEEKIDYVKLLMGAIIFILICLIWIPCLHHNTDFTQMAPIGV